MREGEIIKLIETVIIETVIIETVIIETNIIDEENSYTSAE